MNSRSLNSTPPHYSIELSLKAPSGVLIEGEVIDAASTVVAKIPCHETYAGNTLKQHHVIGEIENVSLRVRAQYTASNGVLQTPELILSLMWISPSVIHTLIHPTKRKSGEPVRRYDTHKPSYNIFCGSPKLNYIGDYSVMAIV